MKIAILSSFYPSTILSDKDIKKYRLKNGHMFPWITNLAEGLAKNRNHDVHVVTMSSEFDDNYTFSQNGVAYNFLKSATKYTRLLTCFESDRLTIKRFLKKEKFDIVHGQGFQVYGYYAVMSGLPNVITIHLYDDKPIKNFFLYDKFSLMGLYNTFLKTYHKKMIMEKVNKIVSISPYIRKILEKQNKHDRIADIENAMAYRFFNKESIKNNSFALYIGSIDKRKSVLDLIKAMKLLRDKKLKIISTTNSGEYFSQVTQFIDENNLSENVEFLGPKKNKEIVDILKECSFLVLPSKRETAPMVISEAMSIGKPVIASSVNGIPYMIRDGKTGYLFEPGNVEQLADRMNDLFKNNELCDKMGVEARQEAINRWHPDIVAAKTLEVYEQELSYNA